MSNAVVVDRLTTNNGVMINSGKTQNLLLYKVLHLSGEMSADIDMWHIITAVIVGRQSCLTALAVIRHHKIIM